MRIHHDFLENGETVLLEGRANKRQTLLLPFLTMTKGGMLVLTDSRLVFVAHAMNFGKKFESFAFSDIAYSGDTLSIFVPTPNMIKIGTKDGKIHQFIVAGKQKMLWKEKIAEAVQLFKAR